MSNSQLQDQTLYCDRCGISFLWSAEEQKTRPTAGENGAGVRTRDSSATRSAPPTHCPGCQQLLPASGRERGLVKWYNRRKRFGFLVRRDHPEIFAHGSDIEGASTLRPGDLVEFSVEKGARGLAAKAIIILDHGDPPTPD